jgi:hypothetical protein
MMPDAPGMFSTTTTCPSPRDTPSARRRAITSVAAPGPVGTISLIGRAGQVCAPASAAGANKAAHSSARMKYPTTASEIRGRQRIGEAVYYPQRRSQAREDTQ